MKIVLFLMLVVPLYASSQDEIAKDEVIMISPKTPYACDHRLIWQLLLFKKLNSISVKMSKSVISLLHMNSMRAPNNRIKSQARDALFGTYISAPYIGRYR